MSSSSLPTILLLTGALTAASCYDKLVPILRKAGYPTIAVALASVNPTNPAEHTAETDGKFFLDRYLLPLIEEGNDVVVFAHSFGATSMSGADLSLTKSVRESKDQKGGVVGIIYISGCLSPHGQSQEDYLGGAHPPFVKQNTPSDGLFMFDPVIPHLFNDAESESAAAEMAKGHLPHAMRPLMTPVSQPLWSDKSLDGRRVYLKTMRDTTFPPGGQQMFIDNSAVPWEVVEVDGGHEAFLTRPALVADAMLSALKKW